ncbi:MAG TPA: N-acetylmuramoyl-L-alanine amidase [Fimbriimonadales bacterium]|nr:N-acetylmuramoyl-L-alanine amidase [Fimbriimonadales bacterium]
MKKSWNPSPNYDERPRDAVIDTIVLHATVFDSLEETIEHFSKPESKVSAHYTIDRDGTTVQHVEESKRAWHAGVSEMPDGRKNVNDFSIGIELVNKNSGFDVYPSPQITALKFLVEEIISRHPIRNIVTHAQIARPLGRKDDPKGFPSEILQSLLGKTNR